MRAVDTNVLVRLLARDTPAQVATAEAFVAPGAWVSHLVLAEAMWVLAAVYGRTPCDLALPSMRGGPLHYADALGVATGHDTLGVRAIGDVLRGTRRGYRPPVWRGPSHGGPQ